MFYIINILSNFFLVGKNTVGTHPNLGHVDLIEALPEHPDFRGKGHVIRRSLKGIDIEGFDDNLAGIEGC